MIIRADIFPAPVRGICCTSGATLSVVHDNLWPFLLNMWYKCRAPQVTDTCTSLATTKWNPQDFIRVVWQLHFQGKKPKTDVSFRHLRAKHNRFALWYDTTATAPGTTCSLSSIRTGRIDGGPHGLRKGVAVPQSGLAEQEDPIQKGQVAYGWRDMPVPHAYPVKKKALVAKVRLGLEVAAPNLEILWLRFYKLAPIKSTNLLL